MSDRGNSIMRFGDRFLGIPLIFILGLFRRKRRQPETFKSIAFLATAAIGDTLLISAVLKDLIKKYPEVNITIFSGKSNRGTFDLTLPNLHIVTIPVSNPLKALKIIREESYDILIDFGPWPRVNSLIANFSRASFKVGFKSINQYRHYIYDLPVEHRDDCHEIDNLRRLVNFLNVESKSVPVLGENSPLVEDRYIVVHMFPSGYKAHYKEWSDSKWVDLIDGLTDKGLKVLLTGAPKDKDASNRIISSCKRKELIEPLAGKTNLKEVGEILKGATKVVSVNTGIMHMAAAYNASVVALHGPTSPLRWGPLCDNKVDFCATSRGAGKLHLGFEYITDDPNSLDTIDSNDVLNETLKGVL